MTPEQARRNALTAGAVTAVAGPALLLAPERLAGLSGVDDARLLRLIGLSDVALAPGLLLAPGRWPWVGARAVVNATVGVRLLRERSRTARTTGVVMLALTAVDGWSAVVLRRGAP